MLRSGDILQTRYRIVREVASGGMGKVYLAEDTHLPGYRIAIKEMSPDQVPVPDRGWAVSAFQQEAQLLATLNHPGVVRVSDHFSEGGNWYLVMEFIEGQTLESYVEGAPRGLLLPVALGYIDQVCAVLHYLHNWNPPIIFRDLKPGNIMISPRGEVKLIDFGIARFFKTGQTRNTVNLGTPGYASPEHSSGQTDRRSDVYSLGVLLLQLVTGYDPTQASVPFLLPPARSLNPNVPVSVEETIRRATQMAPAQRFQNVVEFRQALYGQTGAIPVISTVAPFVSPGGTVVMTPAAQPAQTTAGVPKWVWAVLALLGLLIAGFVIVSVSQLGAAPTPLPPPPVSTNVPVVPVTKTIPTPTKSEPTSGGGGQPPTVAPTPTPQPSDMPVVASQPNVVTEDQAIGHTAGGRAISLLRAGNPDGAAVVVVGGIEGGEQADTSYTVQQLLDWYRDHADEVPNNGLLYLIPKINPDGSADNSRFNLNGVDMNRNWDSGNWTGDAIVAGYLKHGSGGTRPFSEPETQALRDLLNELRVTGRPVYLVVLHSTVSSSLRDQVFPGYTSTQIDPASENLARRAGSVLGYRYNTEWSYDTTGEAIAWSAEQGIPAIDIVSKRDNGPSRAQMTRVIEEILR
jgi:serine/threonine protein kinase, bacterial